MIAFDDGGCIIIANGLPACHVYKLPSLKETGQLSHLAWVVRSLEQKLALLLNSHFSVQISQFVFDGEMPSKIVAAGHLNSDGIEESISATLLYSGKVKIIVISKTFFDFHIYKYS